MFNTPTLSKYLLKLFLKYLLLTSLVIIGVLFISNAFDILSKFKSTPISPEDFWQLITFKVPFLFNEVSILVGFISTLFFLKALSGSNEMTIIISCGQPIWKIFIIPVIVALVFGVLILAIINPVGTYGLREYQKLEAKITNKPDNSFTISQSGIFFFEKYRNTHRIIQTKSINPEMHQLSGVTILISDLHNNLIKRIDADTATLSNNIFEIKNAKITSDKNTGNKKLLQLPTKLTISNLTERFIPPEMILIWNLQESINKIAKSGMPITSYQIYYYKQIFKPIIIATMILLGCWFVSLNIRDNSGAKMLIYGLFLGVTSYFLLEITIRILAFSGINPILATLLPALLIILLSNFVILHFQEA